MKQGTKKLPHIFINKKQWRQLSEEEMREYQQEVFAHYKREGFPYFSTDADWRDKEYSKLVKYDFTRCIDAENKLIKQTMHGLSLCWSFHPYHYSIPCNNLRTVSDTFNDDELLKQVIAKRIRMGDNMSDNGLRKMLKIFSGTQCVSNFRPTAAAAIYRQFSPEGGTVYDMSAGFGGRLLGAHIANRKYIGVDPSIRAFNGDVELSEFIGGDALLYNQGSEERAPIEDGVADLCFTSPPYFDCEKYCTAESQSYKKFPTKGEWLDGFLRSTLIECIRVKKKEGKIILNIQNVKSFPDLVDRVINLTESLGLKLADTWGLQLSALAVGGHKTEPVLIFNT
jgi:hypothetical protein